MLLWATPRGEKIAFEVSRAVEGPLQGKCGSAPVCPGEQGLKSGDVAGWIDPTSPPIGECPYAFGSRGECIRARNAEALEAALFSPVAARLVANYLRALSFDVQVEEVPPGRVAEGTWILHAHSKIGETHDVRVLGSPGGGELVLVRDLGKADRRLAPGQRRSRPCPERAPYLREATDRASGPGS
jgi:hypothetical protein